MSRCDCEGWDEDGNPEGPCTGHKEEPDCASCNDSGGPCCEPHPNGCTCTSCEIHDPWCACTECARPAVEYTGPFADGPPF